MSLRFALAPTGDMHIGNIKIALLNYIFSKKLNKKFLLRIDDTKYSIDNNQLDLILKILQKFRIIPYKIYIQSKRIHIYKNFLYILEKIGLSYIDNNVIRLNLKLAFKIMKNIYCMQYYNFLKTLIINENNIENIAVCLIDKKRFFYNFTSAIDDIEMNIDIVIRGEDHVRNTNTQVTIMYIFKYINFNNICIPQFFHVPLIKINNKKISKSNNKNEFSIKAAIFQKIEAITLINILTNFRYLSLMCIVKTINFNHMKSVSNINFDELKIIQKKTISKMSFHEIIIYDINSNIKFSYNIWEKIYRFNCHSINQAIYLYKKTYSHIILYECQINKKIIKNNIKQISILINNYEKISKSYKEYYSKILRYIITFLKIGPHIQDIIAIFGINTIMSILTGYMYQIK